MIELERVGERGGGEGELLVFFFGLRVLHKLSFSDSELEYSSSALLDVCKIQLAFFLRCSAYKIIYER